MAQADSKNSITAPIDTTRRRFLTVAAIGSMVGAGSLAAVAMNFAVMQLAKMLRDFKDQYYKRWHGELTGAS